MIFSKSNIKIQLPKSLPVFTGLDILKLSSAFLAHYLLKRASYPVPVPAEPARLRCQNILVNYLTTFM
jgi:hypothetical protein